MRNINTILFVILFAILTISCQHNQKQKGFNITSGKISKTDVNYDYSIKQSDNQSKIPLLVVVDPHGSGKYAIEKFEDILDRENGLIIGLNNVRNNTPGFANLIYKALNNAVQNFPVDKSKIYLAGFSGGARMAFQYAINYGCSGLIMCGAGPSYSDNINIPFPLVMITGTKDFNFIEQYYPPSLEVLKNNNIITLHFKGNHEWPSDSLLLQGYDFISRNNLNVDNSIKSCIENSKQQELQKEYLLSFKQLERAYKIAPQKEKENIKNLINELISKNEFKNYISELQQNLQDESNRNRDYIRAIELKDSIWWKNEIKQINKFSSDEENTLTSESYSRTKAFLGILLFSKTNQLIQQKNQDELLRNALFIYQQLEPKNPDVFYYKSLFAIHNQDTLTCIKSMKTAFKYGFSDSLRLHKDFSKEMINYF